MSALGTMCVGLLSFGAGAAMGMLLMLSLRGCGA
jgi:hypothetical protein